MSTQDGAHHSDVTGGLAAHPAEQTLHLPEQWQDDRPGCACGRTGAGRTEISGVPAYNPYQNRRRFTTKTKYYQYWVRNDLFDLVLVKSWGSLTSKRGNQQSVPVVHHELDGLFALIDKTRLAHGYLPSL